MSLAPLPKPAHCEWCTCFPRVDWFRYPGRPDEHFVNCTNGKCQARGPVRDNDIDAVADWDKVMAAAKAARLAK